MVTISEVKGNSRENRTAAHTHIKGLGLKSNGYAETTGAGFVGQAAAREVSSLEAALTRLILSVVLIYHWMIGMWCGSRPDPVEKNVRTRRPSCRRTRNRKDCLGVSCITGTRDQGAILPNRGQRGIFHRGQKDRGFDGEFPEGYWYDSIKFLYGRDSRLTCIPGLRVRETKEVYEG